MSRSADRRATVVRAACAYDGVLSRSLLADLGADRRVVAREVAAGRWATHGCRTVAVHTAPLSEHARRWRAIWEVGCGAALDGVTALDQAGLLGFAEYVIHVSVSHATRPQSVIGVRIQPGGPDAAEVLTNGIPRGPDSRGRNPSGRVGVHGPAGLSALGHAAAAATRLGRPAQRRRTSRRPPSATALIPEL